ncbi:LOW QUALITY PROTEIN: protein ZBED8-like [Homalodisca vitripennis]|uniref:LOW QUALITY PROTEIN: protein ZBED8-like n=1 Tax=Homalodisca vitripennis TaxID=197043 RepID=UPI001EEC0B5E|nr:LOW QUALITY PROTEIN: protein ZBED8-like [Homalodisca vitripennis]
MINKLGAQANYFKFDSHSAVVPSSATASASFVRTKMATFTGAERACCVLFFHETNSATSVQRRFRTEYGRVLPSRPSIYSWHKNFVETGCCVRHEKSPCRPQVIDATVEQNFLIPQIDEDEQQDAPFCYQQDGAPPHYLTDVRDFLNGRFPDNIVKRRIDDMAKDIKNQVVDAIKKSPFFAIRLDESTDIAQCSHLLVYVRYIENERMKDELMFSTELLTTTKAVDVMEAVSDFFKKHELSWQKLIGVCTDGAPSMLGSRSGFVQLVKEKNADVVGIHCFIHRQALAAKTLPNEPNAVLKLCIKVVNYVKNSALNTRLFKILCEDLGSDHKTLLFHTEVRWLSKGNMLGRLFELRDEVITFLAQ